MASFAVLADERAAWRPSRYSYSLWGTIEEFQFPVVKLLDYATDVSVLEVNPNPFAVVVLAHLKTQETGEDQQARRAWKVRLVKGLYARGLDADDIRQLFRVIDWMMDLPKPLERYSCKRFTILKRRDTCRSLPPRKSSGLKQACRKACWKASSWL